ncbi:radical SAM protein [bacterium]|nr:MAG: radical SAM protein [bacterium]
MFRKIYLEFVWNNIKSGRILWLISLGFKYLATYLSMLVGRPLCGPILGTLVTNYTCNLDCLMCDLPHRTAELRKAGGKELDTAGMKDVMDQMKGLGILGIGFTGGEPLIRPDIFELLSYAKKIGMITHLNTNGTLLDEERGRKVIEAGVDSLNISIDGATAETHDSIRSVPGSFEKSIKALKMMDKLRKEMGRGPRLKAVCVVQEKNVDEVEELLRAAPSWGVDVVECIPRQEFTKEDSAKLPHEVLEKLKKSGDALTKLKKEGAPIENSQGMIRLFKPTFEGKPSPLKCYAGYNSLTVDSFGEIYVCVPYMNWNMTEGNIAKTDLKTFWKSSGFQKRRKAVEACRRCTLNCQAELNILFQPWFKT